MFTLDQIQNAHSQVKTGADFPAYIQAIKQLGVTHYETYVQDGHICYFGENNHEVRVPAKYAVLSVAESANQKDFQAALVAHQQGKTDFLTFIHDCAANGINKWEINIGKMTCTYFDKQGNTVLEEIIPE